MKRARTYVQTARAEAAEERAAPAGDPPAAITVLVDHYEARGRGVLALLADEGADPRIARILERGRTTHRAWVADVFGADADALNPEVLDSPARSELLRLLVVATDVYTWKLLRLDMGLSRSATERHLLRLVDAVLSSPSPS